MGLEPLAEAGNVRDFDVRERPVMLDLVLQAGERLEDLLALLHGLGVLGGRDGLVDVVDAAGLLG